MTSEVWKARLNGGYLGTEWVKELLADFEAAEALSYRVPTQWAYDQVCAARTKWEERVKDLEAQLIQEKLALEYCGNECKLAMDKAIKAEQERDEWKDHAERFLERAEKLEEALNFYAGTDEEGLDGDGGDCARAALAVKEGK